MGDDFGNLGACDAVLLGSGEMIFERIVGNAHRNEGSDGDEAAVAQRQEIVTAPDLAEKDIVI